VGEANDMVMELAARISRPTIMTTRLVYFGLKRPARMLTTAPASALGIAIRPMAASDNPSTPVPNCPSSTPKPPL
jgi:hypothetical protein